MVDKSPASASSVSPVVYGNPADPVVGGVAGGFDMMEIRAATQVPQEGGVDVDAGGFVRSRRASAPKAFN